MNRTATWANIGTNLDNASNISEVLQQSGLNYTVHKEKIVTESGLIIPEQVATVKDNGKVLGVVGKNYEICQNAEAFDFANYIDGDVEFIKAGETHSGMVYIIGVLPEVRILGDAFTPNVIFRNGFSGNVKITAAICPLRLVCQNQFNFAFKHTNNAITIRHMKNADAKLAEARDVLKMSADYMAELNKMAEQYADIKLIAGEFDQVMDRLFPMTGLENMKPYQIERLELERAAFKEAYLADDNSNFRGNAWGVVNAYTDFITHKEPYRNTKTKDEGKFMTVTFHPGLMNAVLRSMQAIGISV